MSEKISFFLPVRRGSQRVLNKNNRQFSGFPGGLLELKLKQLLAAQTLSEIIVSTNDEESIRTAKKLAGDSKHITILPRPEHLCLDSTPLTDLIVYAGSVASSPHIIWGHVTTPFITGAIYDEAIDAYFKNLQQGFDSLISVTPFRNYLIDPEKGTLINVKEKGEKWPRTQDLPLLYEVNHAMFIAPASIYTERKNRMGDNPFYYEMDKLQSFDIDWDDDFLMAEALYDKLGKV